MNSAYGKTIQKPIKNTFIYKKYQTIIKGKEDYPLNKYLIKNSAKVIDYVDITKNLAQIKTSKQIDDFATNTLLGVQILSMSKRIMNEVMCTAEDLDIKIFYQDTDSMHIEKSRLNDLKDEFEKRFGRKLIADPDETKRNLGEFHNDFDEFDKHYPNVKAEDKPDCWAYTSMFLGKKAYIDLLRNEDELEEIHYRMKGVTLECIKLYAKEHNMSLFDVYDKLLVNESITFDLLTVKARFTTNKNRTISNVKEFKRKVKFEGEINIY